MVSTFQVMRMSARLLTLTLILVPAVPALATTTAAAAAATTP